MLPAAEGPAFVGDLQPHVEVAKAKASIERAIHERIKPPSEANQ
jgi:hypothetical protein